MYRNEDSPQSTLNRGRKFDQDIKKSGVRQFPERRYGNNCESPSFFVLPKIHYNEFTKRNNRIKENQIILPKLKNSNNYLNGNYLKNVNEFHIQEAQDYSSPRFKIDNKRKEIIDYNCVIDKFSNYKPYKIEKECLPPLFYQKYNQIDNFRKKDVYFSKMIDNRMIERPRYSDKSLRNRSFEKVFNDNPIYLNMNRGQYETER